MFCLLFMGMSGMQEYMYSMFTYLGAYMCPWVWRSKVDVVMFLQLPFSLILRGRVSVSNNTQSLLI